MPMQLPTDTVHLQLETRQYELFNRPLGQGVSRRTLAVAAVVCGVWFALLIVLGISPVSRFGPTAYIVPPFVIVFFGTKRGEDGRMNLLLWYDAILARLPSRRKIIRNPLLPTGGYTPTPIRMVGQTTELHTHCGGGPLTPLLSRAARRSTRQHREQR